jgi:hypothetical protein
MKAISRLSTFVLFACVMAMLFSTGGFAQEVVAQPSFQLPSWTNQVLAFLTSIPKVGPILEVAFVWIGSIAALFTALAVFARSVLAIPLVMAKFAGAQELAEKIEAISKKVNYYLDQLSIFNAKK